MYIKKYNLIAYGEGAVQNCQWGAGGRRRKSFFFKVKDFVTSKLQLEHIQLSQSQDFFSPISQAVSEVLISLDLETHFKQINQKSILIIVVLIITKFKIYLTFTNLYPCSFPNKVKCKDIFFFYYYNLLSFAEHVAQGWLYGAPSVYVYIYIYIYIYIIHTYTHRGLAEWFSGFKIIAQAIVEGNGQEVSFWAVAAVIPFQLMVNKLD